MKRIKLMADYGCYPLWEASPGHVGEIDPRSLPISKELVDRLLVWAEQFDQTLVPEDPRLSGFETEEDASKFRRVGYALFEDLKRELGNQYEIIPKINGYVKSSS